MALKPFEIEFYDLHDGKHTWVRFAENCKAATESVRAILADENSEGGYSLNHVREMTPQEFDAYSKR